MKKVFTPLSSLSFFYLKATYLIIVLLGFSGLGKTYSQNCTPISTLSCNQIQVNLPYSLSFTSGASGTLADKNGAGTGFTMADAYTGTRLSADGTPTDPNVHGYEASKLTLTGGRLQIVTNKGIASLTNNNQINALGVKVNSQGKLQIEVSLVNPFNGTSYQQGGIWFGLSDKIFIKLVTFNNKVQLYKEVNDVSGSSDNRLTGTISGLDTKTLRLRMIVDPATNTVEGFYSIDGTNYVNVGTTYSTPSLSISGMGLTSSTAYAGIFATHRNSSTPVTYTFDDFSVQSLSTSGSNQAPAFTSSSYTFSLAENAALNTTAGTASATDPNGDALTYSITAGNTNGTFSINTTGSIRVAKLLNYHTQEKYTLTVRAADPGGLAATAAVTINVTQAAVSPSFSTISWGTVASQPYSVNESQGKVVNGKLYTFGGFDSQKSCCTPTDRAYVYDPVTNTWTPIAPMPPMNGTAYGGVTHAGFTTDGTDIYFAGGYTSNSSGTGQIFGTREVWKYIVSENRYERLPNLPMTISAGQLEYLNGRLHHIAGTNSSRTTDLDVHYVLNLDNLAAGWSTLAPLPNARHHAGSAVFEGRIYFIGGQKGHDGSLVTQKDVHRYDPAANMWTKVADLPVPSGANGRGHISNAAILIGTRVVVLGGEIKHGTSTNMVSAYSPSSNSWTDLTQLPANRHSGVAANLNNRLFYTGGSSSRTTYRGIPEITAIATNAQLFVENLDKFPSNNNFVASRIQLPWSRDKIVYNTNHDTLRVRLHNKGMGPLVVSNMALSNRADWKIVSLKGTTYDSATAFPLTISSGTFADVRVAFVAVIDSNLRVKLLQDNLSIISNDDKNPIKTLNLRGLWQRQGEGSREPRAQEMINIFGFKSRTGFTSTDPDKGNASKPKGDEIISSYFVRVDPSRPVTIRQMGSYHGCCNQSESIRWYPKGNTGALTTAVYHVPEDAQRLLPRKSRSITYTPAEGSFSPTGAFGLKVGAKDWSDTLLTPERKIGIRVWKAIDGQGQVIPDAYIIANDYLGSEFTNYDYNDNMYYVTNMRPELGPASTSALASTPSAVEFSEQLLQSTASFTLNLKSLGQVYPSGAQDPSLTISAVQVVGENNSEFTAAMPGKTVLGPQETTTLSIGFKPVSEGLKTADLLIYYNNASSPLRVPLYGIGKANGTIVSVPYRIKSGSSTNVTVNGKTWVADVPYAFDNLEPYTNGQLKGISATDEDVLYLTEQSSNGDKRPFRYEMPIQNGTYWVRLHFAEIYWGLPGGNLNGGAGSRVMSVSLENELRLINLDVAGEVGSASAVVKNIPVTVSDGKLNINFSASTNRPMVCAVEVYRFAAGTTSEIVSSGNQPLLTEQSLANGFEKPRVYPNPLHHKFTIEFPSMYKGMVNLQLVDVVGRVHEFGKSHLRPGGTTLEMDVTKLNLAPGVYFLRINSENNKTDIVRLLIR